MLKTIPLVVWFKFSNFSLISHHTQSHIGLTHMNSHSITYNTTPSHKPLSLDLLYAINSSYSFICLHLSKLYACIIIVIINFFYYCFYCCLLLLFFLILFSITYIYIYQFIYLFLYIVSA